MRYILITLLVLLVPAAYADWAEAVPTGSEFPAIDAMDQHGNHWTNDSLSGENGFVFFFVRSATW
jgi:hypothetical protein